ncbi:hypothetical protein CHA01nite_26570 [Chryseobacterium hagamense]|uniref:Uncharacterized protein n=1 Tax=Chryseobacterium hagamense TaxID=395935 RepID=A0A511YNZ7_9FLAO|nr:hypothetical protein CHA01nite_26570 [Chryseobacterium hagamense]
MKINVNPKCLVARYTIGNSVVYDQINVLTLESNDETVLDCKYWNKKSIRYHHEALGYYK